MAYQVKLEVFEGPLDLLLYLIKKSEVDIYNIPIAEVARQYLEYLSLMDSLDLHVAGDFLVMASTLMQIKSRMLLPQEERAPEEADEPDPREELVQRLLDYQRFKEVARHLSALEQGRCGIYVRASDPEAVRARLPHDAPVLEASVFDLLTAFSKVLVHVPKTGTYEIVPDPVTVEQKIHELLHHLVIRPRVTFADLFGGEQTRVQVTVTFLALLELVRLQEVTACQDTAFGTITLMRREDHMSSEPFTTG